MPVIERYILRRVFVLFAGALAGTLGIVWITQVLARINLVTSNGQSALAFLKISLLILPAVIPQVLPFALALAVAHTLAVMNSDTELAVIHAAGSPRRTVIRPVLLLALAVSVASFCVINFLNPVARVALKDRLAAANTDLISLIVQDGSFRKVEDGLYLQVREQLSDGRLSGVFVADSREAGIDLVYYAKQGLVDDRGDSKLLVMFDGEINRKTASGDVSIIRFDRYALDLSQFGSSARIRGLSAGDRSLTNLMNPDPTDPYFLWKPNNFRAELHRRLTEWTLPLVFALIALAAAGLPHSHREGHLHPDATVMLLGLAVRYPGLYFADAVLRDPKLIWTLYAVPAIAAAIAVWFIATDRTLGIPSRVLGRVASVVRRPFGLRPSRAAVATPGAAAGQVS